MDHVRDVILLVVESFNKRLLLKEPWGLICNIIVHQPLGAKLMNIDAILQPLNKVSITVRKLSQRQLIRL